MQFIQIALTLWLAALQLQLQVANTPNVDPELKNQVQIVTTQAIEYAQTIMKNPPTETTPIVQTVVQTPVPEAPVVLPLRFSILPQITAISTSTDGVSLRTKRHFYFETNIPATATFYVGDSPRDIGYSTTTSNIFDFDYNYDFTYYRIEVKADGQTRVYEDRCDGSPTCFNPLRTGGREYKLY